MGKDYSKIIGWLVFFVGIILIGWTLCSSYNIFTAKTAVPEFFKESPTPKSIAGSQDTQTQLQNMIGEQLKGLLPEGSITKMLNLGIWSILAGILIFGGTQVSGLGIKLLKNNKEKE